MIPDDAEYISKPSTLDSESDDEPVTLNVPTVDKYNETPVIDSKIGTNDICMSDLVNDQFSANKVPNDRCGTTKLHKHSLEYNMDENGSTERKGGDVDSNLKRYSVFLYQKCGFSYPTDGVHYEQLIARFLPPSTSVGNYATNTQRLTKKRVNDFSVDEIKHG